MDVQAILSLLPENILSELAIETKANRYSKKLQAEVVFKLLLHCILSHKDNSLRTMESAYESMIFGLINASQDKSGIRYSSISERLSTINVSFFEKLYEACIKIYGEMVGESAASMIRFDSTIVTLSGQLLKVGYRIKGSDSEYLRNLKFTIGFSELPITVQFYHDQKYTGENSALKEAILAYQPIKSNPIRIFDRGITARKTHDELSEKNTPFISRLGKHNNHEAITDNCIITPVETETLTITSDRWVYLFSKYNRKAQYPVRYITAIQKSSGEEISFITNIHDLSALEVSSLYKRRWDIEVFFKFLKQELNFSHLINRSENGIQVMLYATLIAAILLLVYKKKNGLKGYKIMKQKFVQDIEKLLVKDIVFMCGGNPELVDKLLQKPPS